MKVGPAEVLHVAALAEIAIDAGEVPTLAVQLESIVSFVARLDQLAASTDDDASTAPVSPTELRHDLVDPIAMSRTPGEMAPAFEQGFYVVPRRSGLADE